MDWHDHQKVKTTSLYVGSVARRSTWLYLNTDSEQYQRKSATLDSMVVVVAAVRDYHVVFEISEAKKRDRSPSPGSFHKASCSPNIGCWSSC